MTIGSTAFSGQPAYRKDIDGLRAIAVLSVVGFHAFPSLLTGGFIGVDVFFVISGYLISGIIFASLEQGSFSIAGFYQRRIRRIFPALLLVMAACVVVGACVLLAPEYRQFGEHLQGSAAFVENLVLMQERGYFDNSADTKPLLHLWSLAVEEQFYIFWPLLLLVFRRRKGSFLWLTGGIAVLSFTFNLWLAHHNPIANFFSPLARFWELMVGGLLAAVALHHPRVIGFYGHVQSVAGFMLLLLGLVLIDETSMFPGWWCLLPVAGTSLILTAGETAVLNRMLLARPAMVWFGLISYPLYLWHWPLLTFLRIVQGGAATPGLRAGAVLLSIVLAWLSYVLIEKWFRRPEYSRIKVAGLLVCMVLAGFTGFTIVLTSGMAERYVVQHTHSLDFGLGWNDVGSCGFLGTFESSQVTCQLDRRESPRYAVLGDSKAGALASALISTSHPGGRWIYFGGGAAGPLVPVTSGNPIYAFYPKAAVEVALSHISASPDIRQVLIATSARALFQLKTDDSIADLPNSKNYEPALAGLAATVQRLLGAGKKVVLLVDNPTLPHPEDCLRRNTPIDVVNAALVRTNPDCEFDLARYRRLREKYMEVLRVIKSRNPEGVDIVDATSILCDERAGICPAARNGHPLYWRTDHLSGYGAGLVAAMLNNYLAAH